MTVNDDYVGSRIDARLTRGQRLLAAGGLLAALAASSCCILPLALFGLGISGAWIGNFTRLAPYQPWFIAAALACVGTGSWLVRRSTQRACAEGEACGRSLPSRIVKGGLVLTVVLIVAALGFDFIVPYFLNS
jgi:mercuric ion transport protein